jgi:cytochrome P450 family 142 subfamily A polypeptide 1
VGANLARLVLTTVFSELARKAKNLTPMSEPDVEANIFARAVKSFTLGVTAR